MPEFEADGCEAKKSRESLKELADLRYRKEHCSPIVLVVDDNEGQRKLMQFLASRLGFFAYIVENCQQALGLADYFCFDLVLMDIRMPDDDGFDCAAKFRQIDEKKGRKTPIIAVTADAMNENIARMEEADQIDDYLLRPFTLQELSDKVCHWSKEKIEPRESDAP